MRSTPKILIHLIAINVIFFIGTQFSYDLSNDLLSLHYFENDKVCFSSGFISHVYAR